MNISDNISIFIENQLPQFIRDQAPDFKDFIETYYQWLQTAPNAVGVMRQIPNFSDPDLIPDQYFQFMRNEFMNSFPKTIVNETNLLKNIVEFYKTRGTEKSYKLLFRILFNDDTISFYYPATDILRASDGHWIIQRSIQFAKSIEDIDLSNVFFIQGQSSRATATKDSMVSYLQNNYIVNEMYLTDIFGDFKYDENLIDLQTNTIFGTITSNGMIVYPGKYDGTTGFLSWDKYLEDNDFYQEYSYQITSSHALAEYQPAAYDLVHPAGTKMFGKVKISDTFDLTNLIFIAFASPALNMVSFIIDIIISGLKTYIDGECDVLSDITQGEGLERIINFDSPVPIWDEKVFQSFFVDWELPQVEPVRFFEANSSVFSFPAYTPIELIDSTNQVNTWIYPIQIVNTSLLVLEKEYSYGETYNVHFDYATLPVVSKTGSFYGDFTNQTYYFAGQNINPMFGNPSIAFTSTRASLATYFNSSYNLITVGPNVLRFAYDPVEKKPVGILIEPESTNQIHNNTFFGAAAGNPGTVPDEWAFGLIVDGIAEEIISVGQENGIDYIDLRVYGTATANLNNVSILHHLNYTNSVKDDVWTVSSFATLVDGSLSGFTHLTFNLNEIDSSHTFTGNTGILTLDPVSGKLNANRKSTQYTVQNSTTVLLQPDYEITIAEGSVVDATFRLGLPQLESGTRLTSPIRTSDQISTRAEDFMTIYGQNTNNWTLSFYDGTTQAFSNITGNLSINGSILTESKISSYKTTRI